MRGCWSKNKRIWWLLKLVCQMLKVVISVSPRSLQLMSLYVYSNYHNLYKYDSGDNITAITAAFVLIKSYLK